MARGDLAARRDRHGHRPRRQGHYRGWRRAPDLRPSGRQGHRRADGHRPPAHAGQGRLYPVTLVVHAREDFTLEAFRRVMAVARAGFEDLLRSHRGGFIYGVTTRPGVEVGTAIPPEEQRGYALSFRGAARGFGRDVL